MCPGIGELRKAAKEGREPDLSRWKLVNKDSSLYFPEKKFIDLIEGGTEEQYRERAKSLKRKKKVVKEEVEEVAPNEIEVMKEEIIEENLHYSPVATIIEEFTEVENSEESTEVTSNEETIIEEAIEETLPEVVEVANEEVPQVNTINQE